MVIVVCALFYLALAFVSVYFQRNQVDVTGSFLAGHARPSHPRCEGRDDPRGELPGDVNRSRWRKKLTKASARYNSEHTTITVRSRCRSMPWRIAYSVRSGPACNVRLMMMTRNEPATTHWGRRQAVGGG